MLPHVSVMSFPQGSGVLSGLMGCCSGDSIPAEALAFRHLTDPSVALEKPCLT